MNATEYKYCEAIHEICHSLAIGNSDPIMNNAIRDLVIAYFPKGYQDDVLLFILHLLTKLQEEQTSEFSSFKSDDYENFYDALVGYKSQFPSIVDKLFTGLYQKNFKCIE